MKIVGWTWWGNPDYTKVHEYEMTYGDFKKRRDIVATELKKDEL